MDLNTRYQMYLIIVNCEQCIRAGFGTKTRVRRKLGDVSSFVGACTPWLGSMVHFFITKTNLSPCMTTRDDIVKRACENADSINNTTFRMFRSAKDIIRERERGEKNTFARRVGEGGRIAINVTK